MVTKVLMVRGSRHREGARPRVMGRTKGTPEAELGTGVHSCHLPSLWTPGVQHGGFPHCLTSEMARDRERSPGHGLRALWMVCGGRRATLGDRGTQEPPQVRVRPLGPVTRDTRRAFPQSTPRVLTS